MPPGTYIARLNLHFPPTNKAGTRRSSGITTEDKIYQKKTPGGREFDPRSEVLRKTHLEVQMRITGRGGGGARLKTMCVDQHTG